jgi:pimeloyl-ACP methyl ester carboxylesterase
MNKFLAAMVVALTTLLAVFAAIRIGGEMPRHVDVGNGTVLQMHVEGKSGPVLILEMEADPEFVLRLARDYRVVEYHRAGWGDSFVQTSKRDATTIATELHTGLEKMQIPPPYFLVGDRIGSLFVRKFSQSYSNEVKGAILLNPYIEEPAVKAWINNYQALTPEGHAELLKTLKDVADQAGELRDFVEAFRAHERIKFFNVLKTLNGDQRRTVEEAVAERLRIEESNREIYGFITGFKGAEKNEILSLPITASELSQGGVVAVPTTIITPAVPPKNLAGPHKSLKEGEIKYLFTEHEKMSKQFLQATHLRSSHASENIIGEDPELVVETLRKMTSK